ncbi:hypothetical protein [Pseudoduganella sp. HUAS MS19]
MYLLTFEDSSRSKTPYGDCVVMFLGTGVPDAYAIDQAYSNWLERNVPPPTILIIGHHQRLAEFHQQNLALNGRLTGLDRLYGSRVTNKVILAGFDYTGQIQTIVSGTEESEDITEVFNDIARSYVIQQCEEGDVIIPAPPGAYFEKQSSRLSSHFIRAESLLQSTASIELLALRLLKPLHDWGKQVGELVMESFHVYIDSMAVWPVAEKLRQLLQHGNPTNSVLHIESIRSYEGLKNWSPINRPAFAIISASTSGGLASQIREKIRSEKLSIWTILALDSDTDSQPKSASVASIPRKLSGKAALDGLRPIFEPDITCPPPGTETISIVGERFLSQPAKPKRVRLVHANFEASIKAMLAKIAKQKLIKVHRGGFDSQSRWTLSADLEGLIAQACAPSNGESDSLLRSWLKNYSSPAPVVVIYPSPEGSAAIEVGNAAKLFADRIVEVLTDLFPAGEVTTLSSHELERSSAQQSKDLNGCSVIVACPVIGNGFILKQISAALRHRQTKGPRLFLALASFPETAVHFTQLKSDISGVALDDSRYDFRCQYSLPIGRLDGTANWREELDLLSELSQKLLENGTEEPWLNTRLARLEGSRIFDDDAVFLPSSDGLPLPLSTGFLLWQGSDKISGEDYGGAVLLSIAGLLQAARIAKSQKDDTSLRTGLFQHALICPESFTRFNDPVIQAALLRAAYDPELNYAVCQEMSRDMARLLKKWVRYYEEPAGAAIGEFLFAIAIGKLKLRERDLREVLHSAKDCKGWIGQLAGLAAAKLKIDISG